MKIGFCSHRDSLDKKSWSGLEYYMLKSLETHCGTVVPLGPLSADSILLPLKVLNILVHSVSGKRLAYGFFPLLARRYAQIIEPRIHADNFDLLLFPGASAVLAYLKIAHISKVYFSDTTFSQMSGYYEYLTNLLPSSEKWGNEVERKALHKADMILYPSHWAAEGAIRDYQCRADKIHVIPCGCNVPSIPERRDILSLRGRENKTLQLLFIGGDWKRKGGELAFQSMLELNRRGIDTRLTVCGSCPSSLQQHEQVDFFGFLDQNNQQEMQQLQQLYEQASILLVPSRAECFGFVFADAAAYGLPVITTETGGISDYVEDDVSGYLLPTEAGASMYADKIAYIWSNKEKYQLLTMGSRDKYEQELNWNEWGKKVSELFTDLHRGAGHK